MYKRYVILWQSGINHQTCALGFRRRHVAEKIAREMEKEGYERIEVLELESMCVLSVNDLETPRDDEDEDARVIANRVAALPISHTRDHADDRQGA